MNAEFSPFAALILVLWFVAGGFAVRAFFLQSEPNFWHWALLVVGVVMLTLGVLLGGLGLYSLYTLWKIRRQRFG